MELLPHTLRDVDQYHSSCKRAVTLARPDSSFPILTHRFSFVPGIVPAPPGPAAGLLLKNDFIDHLYKINPLQFLSLHKSAHVLDFMVVNYNFSHVICKGIRGANIHKKQKDNNFILIFLSIFKEITGKATSFCNPNSSHCPKAIP